MRTVHSNTTLAILRHSFQRITANFVPYLCLLSCPSGHVSGHHATMLMVWKLLDQHTALLFAVDPATSHKPQDLYFGDEVPDNSQAGDGIRSA
jgi:hypothetical protein